MISSAPPPITDDRLALLFAALDQDRTQAGIDLIGWIFADHVNGIEIARGEGITQFHFSEDLALLFLAADVCQKRVDRDGLFIFAKRVLKHYGYWYPDPASKLADIGLMQWSDPQLDTLRGRDLISSQATRVAAGKLWSIDWRWRRAQAGLHDLLAMLEDREIEKITLSNIHMKRPTSGLIMLPPIGRTGAA